MKYITACVTKDFYDGRSVTQGSDYPVIGILANVYLIVDERGKLASHDKNYFVFDVEDDWEPAFLRDLPDDWILEKFDEEYNAYPKLLSEKGFFEDYFDGIPDAISTYKKFCIQNGLLSSKSADES